MKPKNTEVLLALSVTETLQRWRLYQANVEAHSRTSFWYRMKFPMYLFSKRYRFGKLFFKFQLIFLKCKLQTILFP